MASDLNHKKFVTAFTDAIDLTSEVVAETNNLVDIDSILSTDPFELKSVQKLRTKLSQAIEDCSSAKDDLSTSYDKLIRLCGELLPQSKNVKDFKQLCADSKVDSLLKSVKTRLRVLQKNKIAVSDALSDEKERIEKVNVSNIPKEIISCDRSVSNSRQLENMLKPVSLPNFDGTPEMFLEYITIFDELIHNNSGMSNLKKAIYLKDSLSCSAAMKVKGIPAIGSNYERMYQILRRKYDNVPVNQNFIVQKLENLPAANANADSCSQTLDQVVSYINQICCSGFDIMKSNDPLWLRLIYRKFPEPIVEKIMAENCREPMFCVESLIDELENAIFTMSFLENNKMSMHPDTVPMKDNIIVNQDVRNYQRGENSQKQVPVCIFCPGSHPSRKCLNIQDINQIINILKQRRACWKCFEVGHSSFECVEPNCGNCGMKHHSQICKKPNIGQISRDYPRVNHVVEEGPQSAPQLIPNIPEEEIPTYIVQHSIKDNFKYDRIALMIIEADVYNEATKEYEKATVFFDNGSQGTFVSESFIERLKVPIKSERPISLVGINGIPEQFNSKAVDLSFKSLSGETVMIQAQSKHTLSAGFKAPLLLPYDKFYLSENKIKLNTSKYKGEYLKPDILIGLDNYTKLVLNEREKSLPSGYMLAKTVFGNTMYGNCDEIDNSDFIGCCVRIIQDKADLDMANLRVHNSRGRELSSGSKLVDDSCQNDLASHPVVVKKKQPSTQPSSSRPQEPSRTNVNSEANLLRAMYHSIQSSQNQFNQFNPP